LHKVAPAALLGPPRALAAIRALRCSVSNITHRDPGAGHHVWTEAEHHLSPAFLLPRNGPPRTAGRFI